MEFQLHIQQTPRFALTVYSKGHPAPVVSHIENIEGTRGNIDRVQDKDPREKIEHGRHRRNHHHLTPFRHHNDLRENSGSQRNPAVLQELPFIAPEEVARANGHNSSSICLFRGTGLL